MNLRCTCCGRSLPDSGLDGLCPNCLIESIGLGGENGDEPGEFAGPGGAVDSQRGLLAVPGYRVLEELGRGGMGIVYRAQQMSPSRNVALKMLLPHAINSAELRQRFCQEAATLSRLDHPSILPIFSTGEQDGFPWFTMKLVTGGSLVERIGSFREKWPAIAELVAQLAYAVQYAHEHGVLHRDLKPGNVLFDEQAQAYVADFGLAKLADSNADLTRSQGLLGTPQYLAPEIVQADARVATIASDVYGLGAILHELLTGAPPHCAESNGALLRAITESPPVLSTDRFREVPRDLRVICLKCLARLPSDRYRTARELAEELGRFHRGEPIQARPLTNWESLCRWVSRNPALAGALGFSSLLLIGVSVASLLAAHRIEGLHQEAIRSLYASDMHRAFKAVAESKWGAAEELLERHRPQHGQADLRGFEWYHLEQLCRSDEAATLGTNNGAPQRAAFSPDGKIAATAAMDLLVWQIPQQRLIARYPLTDMASGLRFSPDGRNLAVGTRDGLVKVLALPDGGSSTSAAGSNGVPSLHCQATLTNLDKLVQGIVWLEDAGPLELFGAGQRFSWDWIRGKKGVEEYFGRPFGRVAISQDGSLVSALTDSRELCVWPGGRLTNPIVFQIASGALGLGLAPDGRTVVTGDSEGNLSICSLVSNIVVRVIPAHRGAIERVTYSPSGRLVASAGLDGIIRIFDGASWQLLNTLHGHRRNVVSVEFSPDDRWLISGACDSIVKLWDLERQPQDGARIQDGFNRCGLSAEGSYFFNEQGNGCFGKFIGGSLRPEATAPCRLAIPTKLRGFCTSPAGTAAQRTDGEFVFVTSEGKREPRPFPPSEQLLALSPNGQYLVYLSRTNGVLGLWDFAAGATRFAIQTGDQALTSPVFSADSRRVGFGLRYGEALVYEVPSGKKLAVLKCKAWPYSMSFSPDGKHLAIAGFERWVRLWDVDAGEELAKFQSDVEIYWSVALSPDGRRIAAGTPESSLVLWDVNTGVQVASWSLGGSLGPVEGALRFTPDGKALAFCGAHSLRIWRAASP